LFGRVAVCTGMYYMILQNNQSKCSRRKRLRIQWQEIIYAIVHNFKFLLTSWWVTEIGFVCFIDDQPTNIIDTKWIFGACLLHYHAFTKLPNVMRT